MTNESRHYNWQKNKNDELFWLIQLKSNNNKKKIDIKLLKYIHATETYICNKIYPYPMSLKTLLMRHQMTQISQHHDYY